MANKPSAFWRVVYVVYPPFLRMLEAIGVHCVRHFLLGHLSRSRCAEELKAHLIGQGFERAILAWKDPGEELSLRKLDREIFQYHLRLFEDGEIRAHYEYSPEGNPLGHVIKTRFEARREAFRGFLTNFLSKAMPEIPDELH